MTPICAMTPKCAMTRMITVCLSNNSMSRPILLILGTMHCQERYALGL